MLDLREDVLRAAKFLKETISAPFPRAALITGSGLGDLVEMPSDTDFIPYEKIPGLPKTSVPGHQGRVLVKEFGGRRLLCFSGRAHLYEGHSAQRLGMAVRIAAACDVETLVSTCAAGSLREEIQPGGLVVIVDHINLSGTNPLIGIGAGSGETRFPNTSNLYNERLVNFSVAAAKRLGIPCHTGVYVWVAGPSYETPAEARMLSLLGGDVVGMSLVPETLTAAALGLRVLAIACVTNQAPGTGKRKVSHDRVLEAAKRMVGPLQQIVSEVAPELAV